MIAPSILAAAALATTGGIRETELPLPGFGNVRVYAPVPLSKARGVVLFVSGDGGWNLGVIDMARRMSDRAVVAGLSMPAWQKRVETRTTGCWYPAGELEVAAQALEKQLGLPRYVRPILVGYSSGATVVYGALAQAPATTFAGAVSLGFCPDLEVGRAFCGTRSWKPAYDAAKRRGWLPESKEIPTGPGGSPRWQVLQGTIDQVCDPEATARFVRGVPSGRLIGLDKVGHGFSVPKRWGSAFDRAVDDLLEGSSIAEAPKPDRPEAPAAPALAALDLPLEVSWPEGARQAFVLVSGDGGWSDLDRELARGLAARGIAVVGLNALRYFWSAKPPDRLRADLARLVDALPAGPSVFAGGYSFGAEAVPVALARAGSLPRLAGLILIAPGPFATFEISPLDWLRASERPTPYAVRDAIATVGIPALCIEAEAESASGCPPGDPPGSRRVALPGGHHFGGDYARLVETIAAFVQAPRSGEPSVSPRTSSSPKRGREAARGGRRRASGRPTRSHSRGHVRGAASRG